ncbi:MAG: ROK family protein [Acidobacteria bacterium]|nr:ROK family protein [Acidobacteriota bacterium]
MQYKNDNRTVLTLDAGGTNFSFAAIKGNREIVEPLLLPAQGNDLEECLGNIVEGFSRIRDKISEDIAAISFAFPGPANYSDGIIGDLGNLPAFRGGIPLGPMLQEIFNVPVFINNDGNLFALGEAIAGLTPWVNSLFEKANSNKRYKNLFGVTIGTGFGGGIILDGEMLIGDNSAAGEIWLMRHKLGDNLFAEEGVSIRAVKNFYADKSNIALEEAPEPEEIFRIAKGLKEGNRQIAIDAFSRLGEIAGDAIANTMTLIDGLVVIGGGLSRAHEIFLPRLVHEMNSKYTGGVNRLEVEVFNLEDEKELECFIKGDEREVKIPGTGKTVKYDPLQRIGIGISKLGTEKAVHIGAYAYALSTLDLTA